MLYRFKRGDKVIVTGHPKCMVITSDVEFDEIFIGITDQEYFGTACEGKYTELYAVGEINKLVS